MFLKTLQNSWENTCVGVAFLIKLQAKKEAPIQLFSSEFCEIFMNAFFTEHPSTTQIVMNSSFAVLLWPKKLKGKFYCHLVLVLI